MTEDDVRLKLQVEKVFTSSVVAFDDKNKETVAHKRLCAMLNGYINHPDYKVHIEYAEEYDYFGLKRCEVCTAVIIKCT